MGAAPKTNEPRTAHGKAVAAEIPRRDFLAWLSGVGGLGMFTSLWLGGFWQGWQWINPSIPFIDTVVALKPVWTVRFLSGILIFSGIVLFLYNIMSTALGSGEGKAELARS